MIHKFLSIQYLEGRVSKVPDRLISIVHGHCNTTSILEVKHLECLGLAAFRSEYQLHLCR